MRKEQQDQIYKDGLESYSLANVFFENFLFLMNWGIGFILLLPFAYKGVAFASWTYLAILFWVQILLKKHNCTGCYYYGKRCHLGWGKLTALFFRQDVGNPKLGERLTIAYIVQLPLILAASVFAGVLYGFTTLNIVLMILFSVINVFHAAVMRRITCRACKARNYCSGCAVKTR